MLRAFFHAWERRLASVTTDRVVRPFDWGLDWIPHNAHRVAPDGAGPAAAGVEGLRPAGPGGKVPSDILRDWVSHVMADTDAFFTPPPTNDYRLQPMADGGGNLTFPSALTTPHAENNTVRCRYFPARRVFSSRNGLKAVPYGQHSLGDGLRRVPASRAAVLVMPQWNADPDGHVGLCRLLAWSGMSALRLSLPYHDQRMPPELHRADYIVSANIARTLQVCRQAVLDARRAIAWLAFQGYERIGILGTSLGSCLALLTTAHEPLIRVEALNHISPQFADVVWRGLSTRHVREGLDGHIELDLLRALWRPISPKWYLERLRDRKTLLVYARYDLTFPVDLSEDLVRAFRENHIPHEVVVLGCGHYSTGKTPYKFVDGWVLTRFLKKALLVSDDRPH
jgi:dienelactone hydrolase